ncbi:hypothetical protein DD237_008049 [Peronospora effusa]|uniref:HTH CENPB-type domain-containing protein n=1 Tax=Peronospora effusa TaxID=542832 RepID=A0A3R7VZI7_9STRA|nr:hypothetical protein DD237_008049 [Peronospora effusa]
MFVFYYADHESRGKTSIQSLIRHKARIFYELLAPQLSKVSHALRLNFTNSWMHSFMGRHGFSLGGGKGIKRRTQHEEADGKPKLTPETSVISTPDHIKAALAGVPPGKCLLAA